ncbi:MAG: phosphoenolpyruvate synthase [Candidatus Pacebacteria bacterium]|nr:phosphoenolpyruvate synthase [Candidatus Paceibacterota bacterium]
MTAKTSKRDKYILWFDEIDKEDLSLVGGKGANLGEMIAADLPVPPGFVVAVKAYREFLSQNQIQPKIKEILKSCDRNDPESFQTASDKIKKIILRGKIPPLIAREIMQAYLKLNHGLKNVLVAVRSSATAEDLPGASFAGQQATFLNIRGESAVVDRVRACWASLFESRAIFYRQEQGFDHFKVSIAVPVQEMIQSEISGVMFTIDPITSEKNRILIEAIYGLGELIVRGEVIPDRYIVDRRKMKLIHKTIGNQSIQLIKVGDSTRRRRVPAQQREKQKLADSKVIELAKIGSKIHQHYYFPQDIEWGLKKNKFYILQTRPVTSFAGDDKKSSKEQARLQIKLPVLVKGESASPGLAIGTVKIVPSSKAIGKVKRGDILVTRMTTPDFVPAMKKVAAIVTDQGGQTSHAAIVSRELGLPCVIGSQQATKLLKDGMVVTVDATSGNIYKGGIDLRGKSIKGKSRSWLKSDSPLVKTATKLYLNLADPDQARQMSNQNVDGVGLLRAEFMMAQIGIHPKKMLKDRKGREFITCLTQGLKTFCESFAPRPVVYRASDFKTNEYRNLKGGGQFEPEEENPLLGFRGAYRYLADPEVFELELAAILKVRNKYHLRNLWLMIPFVRTPRELMEVKRIVVANGLSRSPSFKLWLMVEIPSNVVLLDEFIAVGIDGVSIGSNDLTMMMLGIDRDNTVLKETFDERNPAVLWALEKTIRKCQKLGISCSICGQAPSLYPTLVEKLVEWGITSISVSPDRIDQTRKLIYAAEEKIVNKK